MPAARITPDLEMHYEVDDYTDPWTQPETVLLLHGNAESAAMWFGWVPTLARHLRVVRTDMRGFARSTPMPRDYKWTLDRVIDDFVGLLDQFRCVMDSPYCGPFAVRPSRHSESLPYLARQRICPAFGQQHPFDQYRIDTSYSWRLKKRFGGAIGS